MYLSDCGGWWVDSVHNIRHWVNGTCPIGKYCPIASTIPTACPAGRYGGKYGLYNDTCSGNCTGGYYCPLGSVTAQQEHCGNPKYYCPIGTPLRRLVDKGYHGVHVDEPPIYYDEKNLSTNEKTINFYSL